MTKQQTSDSPLSFLIDGTEKPEEERRDVSAERLVGRKSPARSRKRLAPLSVRLSMEERARLEALAGSAPLSAYVKKAVLGDDLRRKVRRVTGDRDALARILALLGRAQLSKVFNALAEAVDTGSIVVTPELDSAIQHACADVTTMRQLLMSALGIRVEAPPERFPEASGAFNTAAAGAEDDS